MKKLNCFSYVLVLIAIIGFHEFARGQTYCTANASYQAQYISSVQVGSIYNITLLSPDGYAIYTPLWTAMAKGTGYTITVTNGFGFSTDQCAIWADWNHNGNFTDAGEQVTVTGTPGLGPYTATITPPTSALSGNTRLRVRLAGQGSFTSCGTTMYGETEDYTINVGGTAPVNDIGGINITAPQTGTNLGSNETVTVLINNFGTNPQLGFPVSYKINNGTPVTETVTATVAPGNTYTYSFSQKANLGGAGVTYALKSYTTLASDENHYNDTTARNIFHGWAQNAKVLQGEYFINTDPGLGNGTAITGTYNLVDVAVNLTNFNLPVGSTLYVRFKSSNGKWSCPRSYKRGTYLLSSNATLASAEYFINTDPGKENGTPVTLNSGIANITNLNMSVGSKVYVRVKDNLGRWSWPFGMERKPYFTNKGAVLSYAEYFINSDPGKGNGTPVTISGDTIKITNLNLPVNNKVYIRVKDNLNRWSMPYGLIRYVYYTIKGADLPYAEYFINTDPGQGHAIPLTIANGIMNLSNLNIPVGSVVYIRVKDSYNRWSFPKGLMRPSETTAPGAALAGGEYFINTDPGKGNGIPLTFLSGVTHIDSLILHHGDILYVRAKDSFNRWGPPKALKYHFKDMQNAAYKIKLASNGTTTLPQPMTLFPAPDSTCTWIATKNALTWHTNDTIWVRFQDIDGFYTNWRRGIIANAGPDATICQGGYATLTASGGSSYIWSNGMNGATIQVSPLVTTRYWVNVSDGAGASSVDTVMVTVNPLPSAAGPIAGLTDVCAGSTVTIYAVPLIANSSGYIWTLPTGATGSSSSNTIQVTFTSSAVSGAITVKGTNTCGIGAVSTLNINVNASQPGPAGNISGLSQVCQGATNVIYSITPISNASSYTWTFPAGVNGSSTTNQISLNFSYSSVSGNVTVLGMNSCGNGLVSSIGVTVKTLPGAADTISGPVSASQGQSGLIYSVPSVTGATGYSWTLPPGGNITSGSNTNSVIVSYSSSAISGNVKVSATNSCGSGTISPSLFVNITRPAPVTTAATVSSPPNTVVNLPVTVTGFTNITSLSLRLDYNPAIMNFTSYQNLDPVLSGILINNVPVTSTLSKLLCVWTDSLSSHTIADGSKLFDLVFNYTSGTGSLNWNNIATGGTDCEYTDQNGNPLNDLPSSTYYINGGILLGGNISGNFMYNNSANTPLDSLKVFLKQNNIIVDSTRTNLSGHYQFFGKSNGTYTISATTKKTWNSVNGTDAIKVQRHFAEIELLTEPVRLQAGDVNLSNSINGTDAVKIKRRFTGLDTTFTRGDWTFAKPTIGGDTIIESGSNVTQDFYGLCVGDVNGSNNPGPGAKSGGSMILVNNGTIQVNRNQEFDLPVFTDQDMTVSAVSLVLNYPADLLEVEEIQMKSGDPVYSIKNGEIRLAWSELETIPLHRGQPLIVLKVKPTEKFTSGKVIIFTLNSESEIANYDAEVIHEAELNIALVEPLAQFNIEENAPLLNQLKIYPNPTDQFVSIEYSLCESAILDLVITSAIGQKLKEFRYIHDNAGTYKHTLDISKYSGGVYFLKILVQGEKAGNSRTIKLIINK